MTQLDLLRDTLPDAPAPVVVVERPWKAVRPVSRAQYAWMRRHGMPDRRTWQVLTALAWYRNRTQQWPTAAELAHFMFTQRRRRIERDDPRLVAPRLTWLVKGEIRTVTDAEGKTRKVFGSDGRPERIGGGVCCYLPTRTCRVTHAPAHPVAIREAGSSAAEQVH